VAHSATGAYRLDLSHGAPAPRMQGVQGIPLPLAEGKGKKAHLLFFTSTYSLKHGKKMVLLQQQN